MRRWPVAFCLIALLALCLLPAGAGAAVKRKTAKVALPANGDITLVQARATVRGRRPPRVSLRRARRIGDAKIVVTLRRTGRRVYRLTVLVMNPRGGASAAQLVRAPIQVNGEGLALKQQGLGVRNLFTREPGVTQNQAISTSCVDAALQVGRGTKVVARGLSQAGARQTFNLVGVFICQDGDTAAIIDSRTALQRTGLVMPGCFGTVSPFLGDPREIVIDFTCVQTARWIVIEVPGNQATATLGPPGSDSGTGDYCSGRPNIAACFHRQDGFPIDTPQRANARYANPVRAGTHSMFWVESDNLGAAQGIGSRFFTVAKSGR
jgi:hypothetical protein